MRIIGTQIHENAGGRLGYTVEFVAENGDIVEVHLSNKEEGDLTKGNAVEKAKAMLAAVADFDESSADGDLMDTVLSARKSGDKAELEDQLDEGLEETFPASDPVSASYSSTAGSNR